MLIFGDPCGQFYSSAAQAESGLYIQTAGMNIHTSGLPAGNIGSTAYQANQLGVGIALPGLSEYIIGFRMVNTGTYVNENVICEFQNASAAAQIDFFTEVGGNITAKRGATVLGTSSGTNLISNTWQYVELLVKCDPTNGQIGVRINGNLVLNLTGINTQNQVTNVLGAIFFGSNINPYFQDLYIVDTTGSHNNTYLGDIHISVYNAAGAGTPAINQYTPNGAATVWQSVSATTPTDSTIFASDATPGDRMSVTVANSAVSGTIAGVIHVTRMSKSSSGTRTVSQTITSNGVDAIGTPIAVGTSYAYYTQVSETDPNTGSPWNLTGFNSVQCGVETVT